jgi:hypothetical protein
MRRAERCHLLGSDRKGVFEDAGGSGRAGRTPSRFGTWWTGHRSPPPERARSWSGSILFIPPQPEPPSPDQALLRQAYWALLKRHGITHDMVLADTIQNATEQNLRMADVPVPPYLYTLSHDDRERAAESVSSCTTCCHPRCRICRSGRGRSPSRPKPSAASTVYGLQT